MGRFPNSGFPWLKRSSFSYKEDEKIFQADALKGNQIITYSGALAQVLRHAQVWLSKQLDVPERSILEGVLAVS